MSHTYATLEVSEPTYEEVKAKLLQAEYSHAINAEGEINMHGIALVNREKDQPITVMVNSLVSGRTQKPKVEIRVGPVRVQVSADAAMDIAKNIIECCEGSYADSFIVNFLVDRTKLPIEKAVLVLQDFREFRDKLATEFKSDQRSV